MHYTITDLAEKLVEKNHFKNTISARNIVWKDIQNGFLKSQAIVTKNDNDKVKKYLILKKEGDRYLTWIENGKDAKLVDYKPKK